MTSFCRMVLSKLTLITSYLKVLLQEAVLNYSYFRTVLHKRLPITSRKRTVLHGTMLIISCVTTVLPGTVLITSYFRIMLQEAALIINLLQKELCRTRFLQEFAARLTRHSYKRTSLHEVARQFWLSLTKVLCRISNFRSLTYDTVLITSGVGCTRQC